MKRILALLIALTAAGFGQAASDNIIVVGNVAQPVQWVHQGDIKAALLKAGPNGTVIIPANYIGTDCAPISSCTPGTTLVIDLRGGLFQTVPAISGGSGVTTVSVTPANGVSGSVANPTTAPAITLTLGAITPSSIVDTGIAVAPNTSPICPNGTGGAFTTAGCATGGAPAFSAVTTGTNTTPLGIGAAGTLSPSATGQIAASQEWLQVGPGVISPVTPGLATSTTGGSLATGTTTFVRVTYVGLAVVEPSGEARVTNAGCGASVCSNTVTMPTSCTAGNLPAGVTGCTVWSSAALGTEKQQTASAACVNITTATCVMTALGTGASLTFPQTGITPAGSQAVTCPDNSIPTSWFQSSDGNFYNQMAIDTSAQNRPTPAGVPTLCYPLFYNDTNTAPTQSNVGGISIHHQECNFTFCDSVNSDRAFGVEMVDAGSVSPVAANSLSQYNERIVSNPAFTCNPISGGAPWGETCAGAGRFVASDTRASGIAGAFITGLAGISGSNQATAQASGNANGGYVGVQGGAFEQQNSTNGNANFFIGGQFGTTGSAGNTNGSGIGVSVIPPTVRFATLNIGFQSGNFGTANVRDWDYVAIGSGSNGGKSLFQAQIWAAALVADNSTILVNGSVNLTGGITTTQLTPSASATVTNFGTAGGVTDSYKTVCTDSNGNEGTISATVSSNTSNADLTAVHGNTVTLSTNSGVNNIGCTGWNIYRTVSGSTCNGGACTNGKIGTVAASLMGTTEDFLVGPAFSDTGQAGDGNTTLTQPNSTGGIKVFNYQTNTNCAINSVSPAACGSAAAGAVVVPTTTTTYVVNTTAVTSASRILLTPMSFAGNLPSAPTCVTPAVTAQATISAISTGVSFTMALPSTTGQSCWQYWIVN